ncbi:MAG: DUF1850 domain-containing protein [Treponema sp.]|nr:DUF1850 domain-containing protein [Treponema sp.]
MKQRLGLVCNLFLAALVVAGGAFFIKNRGNKTGEKSAFLGLFDAETGKEYGAWEAPEGTEFAVEFIHSVNRSPVREMFRIEEYTIRQSAVRFSSFGAGMQSTLEEGQKLIRDGDAMIITGYTRTFASLDYIVGTVSDHVLFINDEQISLREMCGRNARVAFRVKKGSKK